MPVISYLPPSKALESTGLTRKEVSSTGKLMTAGDCV
jgi:hypothetical protein